LVREENMFVIGEKINATRKSIDAAIRETPPGFRK
jgi:hypothetical protein